MKQPHQEAYGIALFLPEVLLLTLERYDFWAPVKAKFFKIILYIHILLSFPVPPIGAVAMRRRAAGSWSKHNFSACFYTESYVAV